MSKLASQDKRQMLPTNVRPTHYTLTLTPDMVNFTFIGSETVNINISENTKIITLHVNEIEINSAKIINLDLKTSKSCEATNINYDTQKETVTLTFPQEFSSGTTASLHIEYNGILNDKMVGFYRSSYEDKNGNTKCMITTQFAATDARRAFPSWDEPAIKATFDITLIVPSDMTTLSNMNVVSETQLGDGKKKVKFNRTPLMSTYLVAFIVGDLGYIEAYTPGGRIDCEPISIRVYAPRGNEQYGEFALSVAIQALEYFTEVFGIPFPLPKCDMIAIPDFGFGAMENWGLITYRTANVLFDPIDSNVETKKNIAYTVSHEIAHQWFGNLVTMEWWDHLWLNEGFATWAGNFAVDKFFPDWDIWTQFVTEGFQSALQLDSLRSSHPIEVPVNDTSEISQVFDAISYYKGASVIRMLNSFLGEKVFLSGIRRYLKLHAFGNATTDDLWQALSTESGNDVVQFMTGWTKMVGYPVLTVQESAPETLIIKQCRFLSSGVISPDEDTTIWWVPLGVDLGPDNQSDIKSSVLTKKEITLKLPPRNSDFYQLNARKTGVFRVNYTPERLFKLGQAVRSGLLEVNDRIGAIADAAALATSGYGKTSNFLSFIKEFEGEDKYVVWREINSRLINILNVWFEQPTPIYHGLQTFNRELSSRLVSKLGWEYSESDDHLTTLLRTLIISIAGGANDPDTVKEAYRRFNLFTKQNDESALHPNIRGVVFKIVLSHDGGDEEFEAILRIYRESKTADQKLEALSGLGFAQRDDLIQRALQFAISEEVKNQDVISAFASLQSNPKSRRQLWNFVKDNWDLIHERYINFLALFGNVIKRCIDLFSSEDDIVDIEKFFSNRDCKGFERSLQQSIEKIRVNATWLKRDSKDVEEWLSANGFLK
ncbi:17754_t:CDS:10 [Funneliformis geosporum]|uniref:Aminopeptidase n=1 Tax=Funneliformis geosporum TaxID=1117311 RepID=A0A9W4SIV1_9GLOM|nr:7196_t:CDS:10 [Funneliformis geosporum]CAI2185179.1 17754_t:CDS:10 [Funneliformis geosporum]